MKTRISSEKRKWRSEVKTLKGELKQREEVGHNMLPFHCDKSNDSVAQRLCTTMYTDIGRTTAALFEGDSIKC